MIIQTAELPVPLQGENPNFDQFVDEQLAEHSDFIDEERQQMWEYLTDCCEEGWEVSDGMRNWWQERYQDLRAGFWEEWAGGGIADPWEALNEVREENETLREENGSLRLQGTERIKRMKRLVRKLKRQQATTDEELDRTRADLRIEREVTADLREQIRCRDCDKRMLDW